MCIPAKHRRARVWAAVHPGARGVSSPLCLHYDSWKMLSKSSCASSFQTLQGVLRIAIPRPGWIFQFAKTSLSAKIFKILKLSSVRLCQKWSWKVFKKDGGGRETRSDLGRRNACRRNRISRRFDVKGLRKAYHFPSPRRSVPSLACRRHRKGQAGTSCSPLRPGPSSRIYAH
jgi:hypothetical protein